MMMISFEMKKMISTILIFYIAVNNIMNAIDYLHKDSKVKIFFKKVR